MLRTNEERAIRATVSDGQVVAILHDLSHFLWAFPPDDEELRGEAATLADRVWQLECRLNGYLPPTGECRASSDGAEG